MSAAIKVKTGEIVEGTSHFDAYLQAHAKGHFEPVVSRAVDLFEYCDQHGFECLNALIVEEGFVRDGEFLNRAQALARAYVRNSNSLKCVAA